MTPTILALLLAAGLPVPPQASQLPPWYRWLFEAFRPAGGGGSGTILTVTGVSPLALVNALAALIHSLKQYGKCVQSGTTMPSAPADILCNNGALRVRRQSGLPLAYQMVEWLKPTGTIPITGFKTKSTQELETVFYRERSGAAYLYSSDTATSGTTNTTAYITSGSGNWRWDGKATSISVPIGNKITSIQKNDGVWLNGTKSGSYSDAGDFVSANDLRLSSSENTTIRFYSQTVREGEIVTLDLVAVQRILDGVYGFYDKVGGEFYTNAEATFTAGDPIADPIEIYTDGEGEVLKVHGENLITSTLTGYGTYVSPSQAAGTRAYKWLQNLPNGTYQIGVEGDYELIVQWRDPADSADGVAQSYENLSGWITSGEVTLNKSTGGYGIAVRRTVGTSSITPANFDGTLFCYKTSDIQTVTDIPNLFATLDGTVYDEVDLVSGVLTRRTEPAYENGAVVIRALATPTTEQTTPHSLHSYKGTTVVEADTNVDPVELSVEYKGVVT